MMLPFFLITGGFLLLSTKTKALPPSFPVPEGMAQGFLEEDRVR